MGIQARANNLTQEDFERLLARLAPERQVAAEKYLLLRRKLVKVFERRGCVPADDLADEALDRIAHKLENEEVRNLSPFSHGVALMICMEFQKGRGKVVGLCDYLESEDALVGEQDPESRIAETMSRGKEMQFLQRCLQVLSPEQQQWMVAYYDGERHLRIQSRRQLAQAQGISLKSLRDKANWLRAKLGMCLRQCLRKTRRVSGASQSS